MGVKLWTQRGSYFYSQSSLDFMYIKISYWNYFWHCHHSWYRSNRKEPPGSAVSVAFHPQCQYPACCGSGRAPVSHHLHTQHSTQGRRRTPCLTLPVPKLSSATSPLAVQPLLRVAGGLALQLLKGCIWTHCIWHPYSAYHRSPWIEKPVNRFILS